MGDAVGVPKQVDQQQRRRQIADALWRVAETVGLDRVSVRRVASEAGMSVGLVQHYFGTREEMLLFAMDSAGERMGGRHAAAVAELPHPPPPREAVRVLLTQFLPLDAQRRAESRSLFMFLSEAARGGPVGERMGAGMAQLREFVTNQVAAAGTEPDPQRAARALLALTDGLTAHVLGGYLGPEDALDALDCQLDLVFPREQS